MAAGDKMKPVNTELPLQLHANAKAEGARRGMTLKEVFKEAVLLWLGGSAACPRCGFGGPDAAGARLVNVTPEMIAKALAAPDIVAKVIEKLGLDPGDSTKTVTNTGRAKTASKNHKLA